MENTTKLITQNPVKYLNESVLCTRWKGGIVVNYFLILGIPETAGDAEINAAFASLQDRVNPDNFSEEGLKNEAEKCIHLFRDAKDALLDPAFRSKHAAEMQERGDLVKQEQLRCFIGHLCVAAGIITYQDLLDAISKQTDIDLPLGQILQERRLLSQTELEGMLMGQKLYGIPNKPLDYTAKRLLELGMVNIDMIKIVVIDQRTSMESLDTLLVKRGFVDQSLLTAVKTPEPGVTGS